MSGRRRVTRWAAVGIGLLAAAVATGAVVAARFDDGSDLATAIDQAPLMQVADIPAADGAPALGVYVQLTKTGHLCVWGAPSATSRRRGGGCNTIDDPLNGQSVSATLSYDGGPGVSQVSSATMFGLARADVASVRILMSDGTGRVVRLEQARIGSDDFKVFGYRFSKADLRKGIGPVAVVVLDASGAEIGRQATGFAG
jgi:hypothetical protein